MFSQLGVGDRVCFRLHLLRTHRSHGPLHECEQLFIFYAFLGLLKKWNLVSIYCILTAAKINLWKFHQDFNYFIYLETSKSVYYS